MGNNQDELGRKIAAKMPFIAAFVGMTIVFAGLAVFYFENPGARLASVSAAPGPLLRILSQLEFVVPHMEAAPRLG